MFLYKIVFKSTLKKNYILLLIRSAAREANSLCFLNKLPIQSVMYLAQFTQQQCANFAVEWVTKNNNYLMLNEIFNCLTPKLKGYRYRRVRKCPKLTYQQIQERLAWCQANINNDFDYFIFIDETKIMINQSKLYHMRIIILIIILNIS